MLFIITPQANEKEKKVFRLQNSFLLNFILKLLKKISFCSVTQSQRFSQVGDYKVFLFILFYGIILYIIYKTKTNIHLIKYK